MISLVVPVYNVISYIEEFLRSVVSQTFDDYEVVLVDDGSTDGTEKILDDYAHKYSRLRVIHKENGGVVSAWKRGISEAGGDYITFADPDDILDINMFATQYKLLIDSGADIVITGIKRLENGELTYMSADGMNLKEGLYDGPQLENIKNNLFGSVKNRNDAFFFVRWNKLFKKSVLLENLDYSNNDVKFGDDVCISASAIYDSKKLYYSHEPLYIYRIRDNSITTESFNISQADDARRLISSVRNMVTAKGYMNDYIFFNNPSYHIIRLMKKIKYSNSSKPEKKGLLKALKEHDFVREYDLKKAKKYISFKRYIGIWLLKHSFYSLVLAIL